jgi:pyruvate formate lyase activating enzyme
VLRFLDRRRGLLDGVVFSGGEPTVHAWLDGAIADVRARGFEVALHTAGVYPRRLRRILPLVDWVGLDVKAPRRDYPTVTEVAGSGDAAFASLDAVLADARAFEVRTTVHPDLTPARTLVALAAELARRGLRRWVLQPFHAAGCADAALVRAAPGLGVPAALLTELRAHVPEVVVR